MKKVKELLLDNTNNTNNNTNTNPKSFPKVLIYIDANHSYEAVKAELDLILELFPPPLVVISGDDYHQSWPGVMRAVDEIAEQHGFQLHVDSPFWWYTY